MSGADGNIQTPSRKFWRRDSALNRHCVCLISKGNGAFWMEVAISLRRNHVPSSRVAAVVQSQCCCKSVLCGALTCAGEERANVRSPYSWILWPVSAGRKKSIPPPSHSTAGLSLLFSWHTCTTWQMCFLGDVLWGGRAKGRRLQSSSPLCWFFYISRH